MSKGSSQDARTPQFQVWEAVFSSLLLGKPRSRRGEGERGSPGPEAAAAARRGRAGARRSPPPTPAAHTKPGAGAAGRRGLPPPERGRQRGDPHLSAPPAASRRPWRSRVPRRRRLPRPPSRGPRRLPPPPRRPPPPSHTLRHTPATRKGGVPEGADGEARDGARPTEREAPGAATNSPPTWRPARQRAHAPPAPQLSSSLPPRARARTRPCVRSRPGPVRVRCGRREFGARGCL